MRFCKHRSKVGFVRTLFQDQAPDVLKGISGESPYEDLWVYLQHPPFDYG